LFSFNCKKTPTNSGEFRGGKGEEATNIIERIQGEGPKRYNRKQAQEYKWGD